MKYELPAQFEIPGIRSLPVENITDGSAWCHTEAYAKTMSTPDSSETKYTAEELAELPTQQRRRILYQRARRQLDEVMGKCNFKCHWCERPLIRRRHRPNQHKILLETKDKIIWLRKGIALTKWWASTDHVRPINAGGDSAIENLVAACQPCNRKRNSSYVNPNPDKSKWIGASTCKCGKEKALEKKKCPGCIKISKQIQKLCRITFISTRPARICGKCKQPLRPLQHVEDFGMVYGCASVGCFVGEWPTQ